MLKIRIHQFFTPPVFEDPEKTYRVRITFNMVLATYAVSIVGLVVAVITNATAQEETPLDFILLLLSLIVNTGILTLIKRGHFKQANLALIAMSTVVIYLIAFSSGGLDRPAIFLNIFVLALAAILFRGRGVILTGLALAMGIVIIYGLEVTFPGSNPNTSAPILNVAIINIFVIVLTGFMLQISSSYLDNALQRAHESERKLLESNSELESIGKNLEGLVAERTASLEQSFQKLEKNSAQLQAITDISQTIVSIQDLDQLLPLIVESISKKFDYYHTAIYLLDETGKYIVLKAASSEGGQRMLERHNRLLVGPSSLVGYVASRVKSRVALDVEQDAAYLAEPDLPETRSEAGIPLITGTQLIGVLDVQSTQPNIFTEQDVFILATLANQVAISIQNARLFSETRQALAEAEKIYQQYVSQSWKQITRKTVSPGYLYSSEGITTQLDTSIEIPDAEETPPNAEKAPSALIIPIQLRGQVIGTMSIRPSETTREWDQDELAMIQATAERAALALENARLLEDSRHRASKERVISDIAAKITGSITMDNILKTAVEELGQIIPSAEVVIQFQNPETEQ